MNHLEEAASLLENNWCAYAMERDGKYCSAGAVAKVAGLNPMYASSDSLNNLPEIIALADEIRESGYLQKELAEVAHEIYDEMGMSVTQYIEQMNPVTVVTSWNDSHDKDELPDILETFKYAAKRL